MVCVRYYSFMIVLMGALRCSFRLHKIDIVATQIMGNIESLESLRTFPASEDETLTRAYLPESPLITAMLEIVMIDRTTKYTPSSPKGSKHAR